jgi:hypothetical protein
MAMKRRWSQVPPRGSVVNHPTVLAEYTIAAAGRRPTLRVRDGMPIVSYTRSRVYLDREAWEMLAPDGVLLMRVTPPSAARFALALTRDELERTFGEVRDSDSWRTVCCYHFPQPPPAARAYMIRAAPSATTGPKPKSARSSAGARHVPTVVADSSPEATVEESAAFGLWAAAWYTRLGARPESFGYLDGVRAWRERWRPQRVRYLLLAESHVAEYPTDVGISVRSPGLAPDLPSPYVRLIYCLGYGESQLCSRQPERNAGTPQFWNNFGQVAFGQAPPGKGNPSLRDRLRWKVRVLEQLRARGIWLQDASPLGLYLGAAQRVDPRHYRGLLRDGYRRFVWPGVEADRPEQVWVIGRGVHTALSGLPGIEPDRMLTQPQDRDRDRHLAGLRRACANLSSR